MKKQSIKKLEEWHHRESDAEADVKRWLSGRLHRREIILMELKRLRSELAELKREKRQREILRGFLR